MRPAPELTGETQTPEIDLEQQLHDSRMALYDIGGDYGFQQELDSYHLDETDTSRPQYWQALAEYSQRSVRAARREGASERETIIGELTAATPDFIYNQAFLNRYAGTDHPRVEPIRRQASHYNELLRDAATAWPELRPSDLAKHLVDVANITIDNPHLRNASAHFVDEAIRGAQHELGGTQILEHSGVTLLKPHGDDDLHGIDRRVLHHPTNQVINIDFKASMRGVGGYGDNTKPYRITHDGHVILYSMIRNHEFHDSFRISDEAAAEKAAILRPMLDEIAYHQQHKQQHEHWQPHHWYAQRP